MSLILEKSHSSFPFPKSKRTELNVPKSLSTVALQSQIRSMYANQDGNARSHANGEKAQPVFWDHLTSLGHTLLIHGTKVKIERDAFVKHWLPGILNKSCKEGLTLSLK